MADESEYSCIIVFTNNEFSITTIRVVVESGKLVYSTILTVCINFSLFSTEPILINPISNYSLNNTEISNTITIGCVIATCGSPNMVNFIDGEDGSVEKTINRTGDGAFNWNPEVTPTLAGLYSCVAENPLGTVSQSFAITGSINDVLMYTLDIIYCNLGIPLPSPSATPSPNNGCEKCTLSAALMLMLLSSLAIVMYN